MQLLAIEKGFKSVVDTSNKSDSLSKARLELIVPIDKFGSKREKNKTGPDVNWKAEEVFKTALYCYI